MKFSSRRVRYVKHCSRFLFFFLAHIYTFETENLFENWQLNKVWQDLSFVFATSENNNQSGFFPFEQKNSDTEEKKIKTTKI